MKNVNLHTIVFIILSIICLYLFYFWQPIGKDDGSSHTAFTDSLRNVIAQNELQQAKYDSLIIVYSDSILLLKTEIEDNNLKIKNLKIKLNEKHTAISKFTTDDITRFLSNRYLTKDTIR